jgi:hypothetical protein
MKNQESISADSIEDLISNHLDVLFCGINPALSAAKSGHHFSNRSNRFWKVLHMAGFTPDVIVPENDASILVVLLPPWRGPRSKRAISRGTSFTQPLTSWNAK